MNFRFPVGLYFGTTRQGQITFHNFLVKEPSDFTCEPVGLLVYNEARDLLRQIRRAPLSEAGVIGKFTWQV
jgi:hypothetical protein